MNRRLNSYNDLPPGTIAAVVTYLEMRQRPPERAAPLQDWSLVPLAGDLRRYRDLFRRVGEPWLWFSRLIMSDEALSAIIDASEVDAFALHAGAQDIGILELDFRRSGQCELCFFGVVPDAVGQGWGRILMNEAIRLAWAEPIERLWVHTCSLDHPDALGFYMRSGFRPYKRAVEIAEDPRLKGYLPLTAAPHMPPIRDESPARLALPGWAGRRKSRV
jgi:GNAT superfamily N-acetyltransferase